MTILTGSQDDGGNGSMGNFRSLNAGAASQWNGGNKTKATDPNVYDFAFGTTTP